MPYTDPVPGHLVLMAYTVLVVIVLTSIAAQHPFQCA
jgi:hypothetical protein